MKRLWPLASFFVLCSCWGLKEFIRDLRGELPVPPSGLKVEELFPDFVGYDIRPVPRQEGGAFRPIQLAGAALANVYDAWQQMYDIQGQKRGLSVLIAKFATEQEAIGFWNKMRDGVQVYEDKSAYSSANYKNAFLYFEDERDNVALLARRLRFLVYGIILSRQVENYRKVIQDLDNQILEHLRTARSRPQTTERTF